MQNEPLLAYLADRFVSQRENLATEALAYILGRSQFARAATIRTFRLLGADLPDDLVFRTQAVGEDEGIPDLVGEDTERVQRLVIEAKFWAGLTAAQPVTYLRRIQAQGGGTLAFIVPAQRSELVWQEILRRCSAVDLPVREKSDTGPGERFATITPATCLGLFTWNALLSTILSEIESAGEHFIASDIRQLQGLCARQDAEAFLPLTSEDLTNGSVPKRTIQFADLVDDLTSRLVNLGIADLTGLRASAGKGWYGRYLRMHKIGCLLSFNPASWAQKAFTPIWLLVMGPTVGHAFRHDPRIGRHLVHCATMNQIETFAVSNGIEIPIRLPVGVEREHVLDEALRQLTLAAQWLNELNVAPNPTEDAAPALEAEAESQLQPVELVVSRTGAGSIASTSVSDSSTFRRDL